MSVLKITSRQIYLQELGFYDGKIDGIAGEKTKAAYLALQKQYFTRTKDIDGLYGTNTDNLLRSVYNMRNAKNFKLSEFKCKCGGKYCTGYPTVIDKNLIDNLEKLRAVYGQPIKIMSGMRCEKWNSMQAGSASKSRHLTGKAADIYMSGISTNQKGRQEIMKYWKKLPYQRYTYANIDGSHPNMGNSVHVDVL
jgi:uncharacterized protein YcbK (DUF882 family)